MGLPLVRIEVLGLTGALKFGVIPTTQPEGVEERCCGCHGLGRKQVTNLSRG